jgi:hypothetical protein
MKSTSMNLPPGLPPNLVSQKNDLSTPTHASEASENSRRKPAANSDSQEPVKQPRVDWRNQNQKRYQQKHSAREEVTGNGAQYLRKLLPGYKASLRLEAPSLARYKTKGGIEELRRKALQNDALTSSAVLGSRDNTRMLQSVLGKQSSSQLASYVTTCPSYKQGLKRPAPTGAGAAWYNMQPTPMTKELEQDLAVLRNREALDPKRFYKSADAVGQCVQVGTIIEGPSEFWSARLTRKERRTNLLDEIMADSETTSYAKNKFKTLVQKSTAPRKRRKKSK